MSDTRPAWLDLPHGETNPKKRYKMPNPSAAGDAMWRVKQYAHGQSPSLDEEDLVKVLRLAGAYVDLTTYPLGQECCVGKLRDIWRARRKGGYDE